MKPFLILAVLIAFALWTLGLLPCPAVAGVATATATVETPTVAVAPQAYVVQSAPVIVEQRATAYTLAVAQEADTYTLRPGLLSKVKANRRAVRNQRLENRATKVQVTTVPAVGLQSVGVACVGTTECLGASSE